MLLALRGTRQPGAVTGIVGIYSGPQHVILYTSNGEVRQEFSIVLTARPLTGQPTPSSESSEVRWVSGSEVLRYTMERSMRIRISDFLARNDPPVIIQPNVPTVQTKGIQERPEAGSQSPGQWRQ